MLKNTKIRVWLGIITVLILILAFWNKLSLLRSTEAPAMSVPISTTTIVVYGDSRSDASTHRKIVDRILLIKPVAVFHTGDFVYDADDRKDWEDTNLVLKPLIDAIPFFAAAGNHEEESNAYYDNFVLPGNEKWYSLNIANAHFLVLNTNLALDPESEQYAWAAQDLETASTSDFIIVIAHHPLLSVSKHSGTKLEAADALASLFERYRVSAVFSGHEHNYERFSRNGIDYIITGGGGAPLYDKITDNQYLQQFIKAYHFCALNLAGKRLDLDIYDENGIILDKFTINSRQ